MDAELKDYQDAIKAVGAAVRHMNECKAKLHTAIEEASDTTGKQVALDTAKVIPSTK